MRKYPVFVALSAFLTPWLVPSGAAERPGSPGQRAVASRPARGVATRPSAPRERRRLGPPQPTRARVDVFRVTMPYQEGVDFSVDSLRPHLAANKDLLDALNKEGKAMLAYRFDETIDLAEESMLAKGQQEPVIKSVSIRGGTAIPTVDYVDSACKIRILGLWGGDRKPPDQADVSIHFETKDVDTAALNIGGGIKAPVITVFETEKSLRVTSGRPLLSACFNVERPQSDKANAQPQQFHACIVRLQLDRLDKE